MRRLDLVVEPNQRDRGSGHVQSSAVLADLVTADGLFQRNDWHDSALSLCPTLIRTRFAGYEGFPYRAGLIRLQGWNGTGIESGLPCRIPLSRGIWCGNVEIPFVVTGQWKQPASVTAEFDTQITNRADVPTLMEAAGLQSVESISQLAKFVPRPNTDDGDALRRGSPEPSHGCGSGGRRRSQFEWITDLDLQAVAVNAVTNIGVGLPAVIETLRRLSGP